MPAGTTVPAEPLRILHVFPDPYLHSPANGLSTCVWELSAAQRELGHRATIHAAPGDAVRLEQMRARYPGSHVIVSPVVGPRALGYSPAAERWARSEEGSGFDVLHQHGLWPAFSRMTSVWRERHHRPTVIALHGLLGHSALQYSRWKKRLALATWAGTNLEEASCLQVSSETEVSGLRDLGLRNPIAVIANGVHERWLRSTGDGARFRETYGIPGEGRILLFLSRIHPSKGLLMMVEAMGREREALRDWRAVVAGPVERPEYLEEVRRRAEELGLQDRLHYTGTLLDQAKRDAFAAADLFALPTVFDNFAIVIAEAAGAGVPVITTRAALPWHILERERSGWWVSPDVAGIAGALREAVSLPRVELRERGRRGMALIERSYLWSHAAHRSIRLYQWLAGDAVRPEFVVLR